MCFIIRIRQLLKDIKTPALMFSALIAMAR
jgi:hypothetical protein